MTISISKNELTKITENFKPWGDFKTTISIGNFYFTFCNLQKEQKDFLEMNYRGFVCKESENSVIVKTGKLEKELKFESSNFSLLEHDEKSFFLANYFIASREADVKNCRLQIFGKNEKYILFAVENFLRWMVSKVAPSKRGLLFHASAKVIDGEAHIFLGNHGAGKSTAVSLIEEGFTIGDDVVLVMIEEKCYFAYTMPAVTKFVQNEEEIGKYKIKAFYKLIKSNENKLKKMSKSLAFATVVASVPFLYNTSRHHYIVKNLTERIPAYELHFRKENNFFKEALRNL